MNNVQAVNIFIQISSLKMKITFILIFCFITNLIYSQVVNIEKKRMDTTKILQGNVDLSINLVKNNSQIFQAQNSIKLQFFKNKNMFLFLNEIGMVTVDDRSYLNDGFAHLRYNRELPIDFFLIEAFTQYQYNGAQNLIFRQLAGAGPRFSLIDSTKMRCFLGTLGMFEFEERKNLDGTKKFRLSSYISLSAKITDYVNFGTVFYYQPNFANFEDYRFSGEASLKIDITKNFLIKIIYQHNYDAYAPEGIQQLNYSLKNSLGWKF